MAEAAQNIPQFKLVLVGDGGTGKVSITFGSITMAAQKSLTIAQRCDFMLLFCLLSKRWVTSY
jgi:hypothetical protein